METAIAAIFEAKSKVEKYEEHYVEVLGHLSAYFSVNPGSDPLFINKAKDIGPTYNNPVDNTCDIDEVSPKISMGTSRTRFP